MTKRLGKRLAALSAAVLMCVGSLATFAPSASAHTATKTGRVQQCQLELQTTRVVARGSGDSWVEGSVTYKPEYVSVCRWVAKQVPRPHIHDSHEVCTIVISGAAGAATAATGAGVAASGVVAAATVPVTNRVCRYVPRVIYYG